MADYVGYLNWGGKYHLGDIIPTQAGILNCADGESELRSQQALLALCLLAVNEVYSLLQAPAASSPAMDCMNLGPEEFLL